MYMSDCWTCMQMCIVYANVHYVCKCALCMQMCIMYANVHYVCICALCMHMCIMYAYVHAGSPKKQVMVYFEKTGDNSVVSSPRSLFYSRSLEDNL